MLNYALLSNAIRILSADAVEHANSGHPGMPMGMAEIGVVLWLKHLKHNPNNPKWVNRDRFILSNGHGSMLIYSLLHFCGYNLTIDDIKKFRQLGSKTPGHPEYGYTDGVETTTGPLGQGLANAVGMALAEKLLANKFNKTKYPIVDHYTYAFVGDGCLMEGISHEVCSFAGTLGLGKLIVFYDDNGISIDGEVSGWFNEDVSKRFKSYGWQVIEAIDGHNIEQIDNAINVAKNNLQQPSLIICKTVIGMGAPNKQGKEDVHGSPLGKAELQELRNQLAWDYEPFIFPQEVYADFDCKARGKINEDNWQKIMHEYQNVHASLYDEFMRRVNNQLPINWREIIEKGIELVNNKPENIATRKSSQNAIEYFAGHLPEILGGSADLTGSNLTKWKNAITLNLQNNFNGNYISYGVREFGMTAMINGIYLHGGFKPFGGTFLMFSEYARNAVRMASLMKIAPIFVYTHDSIGLGEDGPTHQPIEQLATLRLIPNMHVWRPCDSVETMVAWGHALTQTHTPSALIFSRQTLNFIQRENNVLLQISKGGYILRKNSSHPDLVIIATGSEVSVALFAYEALLQKEINVQLVSMPSTSVFDEQDISYKNTVIPSLAKFKVAIEAGSTGSWFKYVGLDGLIIGIDTFGESAKANDLFNYFGLTNELVLDKIIKFITK